MLKLKLHYFGHLIGRADSLEKTLVLGKVERKRRRGRQRMRWLDRITNSMDTNLGKLQEIVEYRETWNAAAHGVTKSWTQLRDWTTESDYGNEFLFVYLYIPTRHTLSNFFKMQVWSVIKGRKVKCLWLGSVQFSSVAQSYPTLCDHMNPSTPGLPVHHQLPEFTQTHVHRVGDAIQPSHPLSSPSPPAFNLSQHQGLFQWVNSLHEVAKVLGFQLQHQSFQWTPRTDLL